MKIHLRSAFAALLLASPALAQDAPPINANTPLVLDGVPTSLKAALDKRAPATFNGEFIFKNTASGLNSIGVQNDSPTGYSAFIGHQLDRNWPWSPTNGGPNTPYEHFAIGYGDGLSLAGVQGLNYWEISRFTTGNIDSIPPTQGAIQQTGGVDVTGGKSYDCSLTGGSTTAACTAGNAITNGMSVSGSGITPGTTVVSGGGTTSIVLSKPSVATGTQTLFLNFTTPAYGQYNAMVFGSGQFPGSYNIDFYRWADGKNGVAGMDSSGPFPYLSLDRVNGRMYLGRGAPNQRIYADAPMNIVDPNNKVINSLRTGLNTWKVEWDINPGRLKFIDGNASASVQEHFMDGTRRTQFGGPIRLAAYTVANLPVCSPGYQDAMAVATDLAAPTYRGALTGGGAIRSTVFCDGTSWTAR